MNAPVPLPLAAAPVAPEKPEPFADGLYLGLGEEPYHNDPALGSTDIKTLAVSPAAYWYESHLNPSRPTRQDTPSRILGSAFHKLVLEGRAAFDARYVRRPDEVERLTEKVRERIAPNGEDVLPGEAYDRLLMAAAVIARDPDLAPALKGGASEVSVFWTVEVDGEPVRRKARFDYLKPRAIVDLKSTALMAPGPFEEHCCRAIGKFGYLVQAAAYLQARAEVPRLIAEGRVYGTAPAGLLDAVRAAPDFAFVLLFWATSGPPLIWGGTLSPGNPNVEWGAAKVAEGLANFVACWRRWGAEAAWIPSQPLAEIQPGDVPDYLLR